MPRLADSSPISVREALEDGGEEAQLVVIAVVLGLVFFQNAVDHVVCQFGCVVNHGAAAFGHGLLGQQHAAHVGVPDQRVGDLVGVLLARQGAHGAALHGIGQRALVDNSAWAMPCTAVPMRAVFMKVNMASRPCWAARSGSRGVIKVHDAGGRGANAHLVLQRTGFDRIASAQTAVFVDLELGHDEQRNAAGALRRVGQARQHDVHNVVGQVMFTRPK